ncbi:hypothetical protein E2C01_046468 [Portunus trituberculatus]|uniref:Uncharacterized protein n=1 Tax=Portunus trituberculatus TaxID=210409 RepID=A0A5B7G4W6_PORTR|nr:hypothetical protein [Portunus trituberculatus]
MNVCHVSHLQRLGSHPTRHKCTDELSSMPLINSCSLNAKHGTTRGWWNSISAQRNSKAMAGIFLALPTEPSTYEVNTAPVILPLPIIEEYDQRNVYEPLAY